MKTKQDWMALGIILASTVALYLLVAVPMGLAYYLYHLLFY